MNKSIIAALTLLVSFSAFATDVSVENGRDYKYSKDFVKASVGTDLFGLNVAANVQSAQNTYKAYGVSASKTVATFGAVSVAPVVGVQYFNPQTGAGGYVGTAGVSAAYALTKTAALTADFTRRVSLSDGKAFEGNLAGLGLKVSF